MALVLNQNRTFKAPVTVTLLNEDGKETTGKFTAIFRNLKMSDLEKKQERLLDLVLVGVVDLTITDGDGNVIDGDELVEAVKDDFDLMNACTEAFNSAIEKKSKKQTSAKSSDTSSTEPAEQARKK